MHIIWLFLVLASFLIQLAYFFKDDSAILYAGKKITTPALLFGGLALVALSPPPIQWISLIVFALMGLGELGIEGSSVVEKKELEERSRKWENIRVTIAGILFLAVNIIVGTALLIGSPLRIMILCLVTSLVFYFIINFLFLFFYDLNGEKKFQTRVYSIGLVVLLAGTMCDFYRGLSSLGLAALILTVSDTLVLVRMAGEFDKSSKKGYVLNLIFLIVILWLYYLYMAVLIHRSSPFY